MSKAEVMDTTKDLEVVPSSELEAFGSDAVQRIIALSEQVEPLGKALDKIRTFILGRALPGDFVEFKGDEGGEPYIELVGAGADRIAATVGISFVDWNDWKEAGTDEIGAWYNWYYRCRATFQGRSVEVVGRAGSRDKFFGFAYGKFKDLSEVKEGDIRTAARRNCMKEGVKVMLGLRRIPKSSAATMGLDLSKLKSVEFGSKKSGTTAKGETKSFVDTVLDVIVKRDVPAKGEKRGYKILSIKFPGGRAVDTFDEKLAQNAKELKGKSALVHYTEGQYGLELVSIATATTES